MKRLFLNSICGYQPSIEYDPVTNLTAVRVPGIVEPVAKLAGFIADVLVTTEGMLVYRVPTAKGGNRVDVMMCEQRGRVAAVVKQMEGVWTLTASAGETMGVSAVPDSVQKPDQKPDRQVSLRQSMVSPQDIDRLVDQKVRSQIERVIRAYENRLAEALGELEKVMASLEANLEKALHSRSSQPQAATDTPDQDASGSEQGTRPVEAFQGGSQAPSKRAVALVAAQKHRKEQLQAADSIDREKLENLNRKMMSIASGHDSQSEKPGRNGDEPTWTQSSGVQDGFTVVSDNPFIRKVTR